VLKDVKEYAFNNAEKIDFETKHKLKKMYLDRLSQYEKKM